MFKNPYSVHTLVAGTPLGLVRLAATEHGLAGLWFDGQRHSPDARDWQDSPTHPLLREALGQLNAYFAKRLQQFDLPLDLSHGTEFQCAVWQALRAIPHGQTTSYSALCQGMDRPAAVRAVGSAVGRNPISVIVPCHRVVGTGGRLSGYAGGLERKSALLALEAPGRRVAA